MTVLTLYGTQSASASLATACKLVAVTGGVSASKTTKVGLSQGTGELFSLGSTATFPTGGSVGAAGVHGYLWDVPTLELQTIASGTWTVKLNLNWNLTYTTMTSTVTARVWKRSSAGVYTKIGSDMTVAGPGASTTAQTLFTLTGSSFPSMDFDLGDKLYVDAWLTVASTGGASTRTISLWASSSATAGIAGQVEIDTPGYAATPGITNLVLYGSSVADTTLTTAGLLATASGGVETSKASNYTSVAANFGEVFSLGGAPVPIVAIPATPTGHGWIYYPGAGTFALGNWEGVATCSNTNNSGVWTLRFFQYVAGSYTSIGTITTTISATAKTTYSFAATSMASVTFAASDGLYSDLWYQDTTGAGAETVTVFESTSSTAGVVSDMQITTSAFSSSSGVALAVTLPGVGTLAGTFSLSTALATTLVGAGTLASTLAAGVPLVSTLPGVGTLAAGAFTLNTALADTLAGVGQLTGTLAITAVFLTDTLVGVGTLAGTLSLTTALAGTCVGGGTLAGTLALTTQLAPTFSGVGQLSAGAFTLATALTTQLAGTGQLSGTTSLNTALAGTLTGVGTLAGTFTIAGGVTSLTVYPNSAAASAVLSTANQLVGNATIATSAGIPKTTVNASTGFGEICSQTQTGAWLGHVGAITDAACNPTGHGWFLDASTLDGRDIVAGNWTPKFRHVTSANSYTCDMYCRAFVYNSGVYTLIGSAIVLAGQTVNTVIANYTWAATSETAASFPTGSHLYIDLWHNILTTTCVSGNTVQVNQSSIAGDGLAAVSVTTPGFQASASGVALSSTLTGVGTLAGSLSLTTALTDTLAGTGILSGTLSLATALTGQLAEVGTLAAGTLSLSTALISTLAGVGALSGTATLKTALTGQLSGVGTLVGTLSQSGTVALAVQLIGVGQLSGTPTLMTQLAGTGAGSGQLSGTLTLSSALTSTFAGMGSVAGILSRQVALSLTYMGMGQLTGTLTIPVLSTLYLTVLWQTRDGQAQWVTRDGRVTWTTRDETAHWTTRDDTVAWETRDDLVTWKARG